ncbi:hypothetical protein [Candidatus Aciduliprofundum boonei]|uniref:Protease PrsW n=1 Tax=Aciduliprofundum boonei (strain DSM 19572 / T469) TaxID=439481 RepID=D3TB89_ACIB4|nr:hypothetical protein [Candidatus Aciduliprofundum boonei]ADD07824.1 hypothetical protein Aboo_0012 [Aciduliprofundum boonei T469]HII54488.1 hypothetical protein [Candidatus Aciduliprofundum boonei]
MADIPFYIATIVGFVPSFALLYIYWGKLEGLFHEKKMFWNYFIGWIMGVIIAIFFLISKYSVGGYLDLSIIFVIFFALFTESFKFIYLNFPKKRGNYELPYFGFALGLGISAIWAVAIVYQYLKYEQLNEINYVIAIVSLFLFSMGLSAIHASTGAIIGYGIYKGEKERFLLKAFALQIIFNFTLLPLIWNLYPLYYFFGIFIGMPYLYSKVYKGVLINVIPKEVKRKWLKERRERGERL